MGIAQIKAFIFGIDGGTWDLIDPLIEQGELPTFNELRREGASARTSTTWPAHTAPGWVSFATACSPGVHGIFQFFDTQEPAYRARILGSGDYGRETCWHWASARGWSLGLVNIPMSHPAAPLSGYQITWPLKHTLNYCRPANVLADLSRNSAHFQSDLATMYRGSLDYITDATEFVTARMKAARHLLENWRTDIFSIVLTEVDRVCHHYWRFCDTRHPQYLPDAPAVHREAIAKVLKAVDVELGLTLKLLPDDCPVVVVSDHGFGPGHDSLACHSVLEEVSLLATKAAPHPPDGVASWFTEDERTVDWQRTKAYMPVPGSYGLNLNLIGRQAEGTVAAQDARAVLEDVMSLFGSIRLPHNGKPAIARMVPREEAYPGLMHTRAPDLLLIPADERLMLTGSLGEVWTPSAQSGLHRHEGMWLHRSPRVKAGRLPQRIRLVDVLPTLFADLDIEPDLSVTGRAVEEVFSIGKANVTTGNHDQGGEWESPELVESLKAMGYL